MKKGVTIGKCKVRGVSRWRVRWHDMGRVRRKFFTSQTAADTHAATLRDEAVNVSRQFAALDQADKEKLMAVWHESQRRGLNLFSALAKMDGSESTPMAVGDVISEMIGVKRRSGLSERYLVVFEMILKQFVKGRERLPINAFTLADVEKYLDSHNPASRQCLRGRVSTLMRFAVRRGYRLDNPCERLEPMKMAMVAPKVFTVEQVQKCLKHLRKHPRSLAWFILSTFAGLRPEEANATRWQDIHFTEGWIRVEAQTSKLRQRRVVYPQPMVFKWLKLAKKLKSQLPIYRVTRIWDLKPLRKLLKFERWPKDVTRHTAASYWLAQCGSAATVATALGHSESILRRHYMALVTKAEAEKFWKLSA